MSITASLCTARISYDPESTVHTATSGPVSAIDEIYLLLERDGETVGLGEMRENIEYLSGLSAQAARAAILEATPTIDFNRPVEELLSRLPVLLEGRPPVVHALIDCALHDMAARGSGIPIAERLGGGYRVAMPSNHCVFWGSDEQLERRARSLLEGGYRHIKLRTAVEDFDRDLERFQRLRRVCGTDASLAIDVNGSWAYEEARVRIPALARFGLETVEQPLAAQAWDELAALAAEVDVPIMLDESASTPADVERIAAFGGQVQAHLKLVKIGGITAMMQASRRLIDAGVHVMVGQMNEGAAATAAAAHCAMAIGARYGELYGADGLIDDPVSGVNYANGCVHVPRGPGLGVDLDRSAVDVIWQSDD